MLRITWTAKKLNKTVFGEADTTRSLISRIRKQAPFFGHVMRREKFEHHITKRRKIQQRKQQEMMLDRQTKRLKVGHVTDVSEVMRD